MASYDYEYDNRLHPQVKDFLKSIDGVYLSDMGVDKARKFLSIYQKENEGILFDSYITEEWDKLNGVPCCWINNENEANTQNIIVFIHGGGWVLSRLDDYRRMLYDISIKSNCSILFIDYALSPDYVFPYAFDECDKVLEYLEFAGYNISLMGNSAGGNLAFAIAKNHTSIKSLNILWGVCDYPDLSNSWEEFRQGYYLSAKDMKWFFNKYCKYEIDEEDLQKDNIFILSTSKDKLSKYPPTLIHAAECDILRDENELLGRKMQEAKCDVTTLRYNGVIHDWGFLNGLKDIPQTKQLIDNCCNFINKYFNND